MHTRTLVITLISALFWLSSQTAIADKSKQADEAALQQMAEIMLRLNHYPSKTEKEILEKIKEDGSTSDHVRILAAAMINIEHYADPGDKEKLQQIIDDDAASSHQRDLAAIILRLSHQPSPADKEKLHKILE